MTHAAGAMLSSADAFDAEIVRERDRRRQRDSRLVVFIGAAAFVLFVGIWEFVHATGLIKPIFVSDPLSVLRSLVEALTTRSTWVDIWSTFQAALGGLIIGASLGIACGFAFARLPVLQRAMNPFLTIFNALPRPALAPIFILWFGLGLIPKVMVAISIVFFVLLINTLAGLSSVNQDIRFLGRSLAMNKWQQLWMIDLPHATPAIIAGLRLGAVYSVLGVVVSEIVAANRGLGQVLVKDTNQFAISASFAVLMLMAALATLLDLSVRLLQRRLSWTGDFRAEG